MTDFGLRAEMSNTLLMSLYIKAFMFEQGSAAYYKQCWYANTTAMSCP